MAPFTVMPIQMFNWISRPEEAFQAERRRRRLGAGGDDAVDERLAIWIRYHFRKKIKW
jgi:phosphate transport system permease protein